jgi:hypothetical protein
MVHQATAANLAKSQRFHAYLREADQELNLPGARPP